MIVVATIYLSHTVFTFSNILLLMYLPFPLSLLPSLSLAPTYVAAAAVIIACMGETVQTREGTGAGEGEGR